MKNKTPMLALAFSFASALMAQEAWPYFPRSARLH